MAPDTVGTALLMADSPREPHRLAGYLSAMGIYGTSIAAASLLGRRRGHTLPEEYAVRDVVLGMAATHKLTRIISKDGVTTPLRAPFTRFEENAGSAEVNEVPKEGHVRHAAGELLSCPFCLAPWIAASYVATLAVSPRLARAWATTFTIVGGSDWLQHAYARVRSD